MFKKILTYRKHLRVYLSNVFHGRPGIMLTILNNLYYLV